MLMFNNTEIFNFDNALRGMRNPLNSWGKSDSGGIPFVIGPNDLNLAQRLISAGPEHMKFMRQIFVSVDITAPLYWWKEMDTYKIGTVANSTSTMHKLVAEPFSWEMFSFDPEGENLEVNYNNWTVEDFQIDIIEMCEILRQKYLETNNPNYWRALVQILPNGFNQTRTWTANYAVLRTIYFQRQNHKLYEWSKHFCDWVESLPYSKELIIFKGK